MRTLLLLPLLLSSSLAAAQEPVVEPGVESVSEPPEAAVVDPSDEAVVAPADEAVIEPADETVVEPNLETAAEPNLETAADPADEAASFPRLELEGCRELVKRRDLPAARICYESASPDDTAAARRVRARVSGTLADVTPPPEGSSGMRQLGELVTSGKAELLATGTVFGGYLGTLALLDVGFLLFQLAGIQVPWELQPLLGSTVFLAPIAGGVAGLAAVALAVTLWPEMSPGDANLLRASLWLATFNSGVSGILTNVYGSRFLLDWWRLSGVTTTSGMLAVNVATVAAAAGIALLTDLPEGAGPLGLSLGSGSAVLAVLGQLMFDLPLNFEHGTILVTAVANAGFAAGLLLSPFVPITRFETWLLDLGAVAGALLGTAIVIGLPAPNPVLGYGGIATGLVLGAGAGVAIGKLVPLGLELVELPTLVAVAPLVLPAGRTGEVPLGAQVSIDIDAALSMIFPNAAAGVR